MAGVMDSLGKSITGSIEKAVLIISQYDTGEEPPEGRKRERLGEYKLQVQYNPETLRMYTQAGAYQSSQGAGAAGFHNITVMNLPPQTSIGIDLIFDDVNNKDAFMWDKFSMSLAGSASTAMAAASAMGMGHEYSVRQPVEALVALAHDADTRHIKFIWGTGVFEGELESVNARFSMFNTAGEPIRATVHLSIRDRVEELKDTKEAGEKKKGYAHEREYWEMALNKFMGTDFEDTVVLNDQSHLQKLSSILNL